LREVGALAARSINFSEVADVGAGYPLRVRWIPVQKEAVTHWQHMSREDKDASFGVFMVDGKISVATTPAVTIESLGIPDFTTIYLEPVADDSYDAAPAAATPAPPE
jgi:hypothetical protein